MNFNQLLGTFLVFLGMCLVIWVVSGFILNLIITCFGIYLITAGIRMRNPHTNFTQTFFRFRNF